MKSKKKYWDILLEKHNKTIYQTKIDTNQISEKNLIEFMKILLSKYVLSDDEILEHHIRIPFKKNKEYINVYRRNNALNEPLDINFYAQVADYSVSVNLVK